MARHGLARLVAARHALWRLRRAASQPEPDTQGLDSDQNMYVAFYFTFTLSNYLELCYLHILLILIYFNQFLE